MKDDFERYQCQIALPDFGPAAQERLQKASVLIVGAGGLGCPVLQYLAAAGVGRIGIADHDKVSLSNLHRQILFTPNDVGQQKVLVAAKRLQQQNPTIEIIPHNFRVTTSNVMNLINSYDLIIEGTDNFETKYLLNDACVLSGKALIYGAIFQYEGQVSIWNVLQPDGSYSANYRDVFPDADKAEVPNCAVGGVMPTLAGIIGCMQATEAIKYVTRTGHSLAGKLWMINIQEFAAHTIKLKKRTTVSISSLPESVATITWEAFEDQRREQIAYTLLDVREPDEHIAYNIGGINIPLNELSDHLEDLPIDTPILCYCLSGSRSSTAAKLIKTHFPNAAVYTLEGGIEKRRKDDPLI